VTMSEKIGKSGTLLIDRVINGAKDS